MVEGHHRLDGHGFGWTPGVGDGQGGLSAAVHGVAKSRTRLKRLSSSSSSSQQRYVHTLISVPRYVCTDRYKSNRIRGRYPV